MMTLEEEGAYVRLLAYCWREGSIPNDEALLGRLAKNAPATVIRVVIQRFTKMRHDPTRLIHKRLEEERQKQLDWAAKSSKGGQKAAAKRWGAKSSKQVTVVTECLPNGANQMGNQNMPLQSSSSESKTETVKPEASTTTEQAACGNVENSRRTPVLTPEEYRAQHPPMNEAAFSKLLDSKDLNQFQNEKPKPSKPTPNVPDYLLNGEERAQPRNGWTKPREVIAIPVHPATELERLTEQLADTPPDSPEWQNLSAEIAKKKASIEMKTKELERKLR